MFAHVARKLRHWFVPHHSNNFRAKILHNSGYVAILGIFLAFNVFVRTLSTADPQVLGFTSSITIDQVVQDTNQERIANGLQPLKYNSELADAARRKAADMFSENYWAHVSPSGLTPWVWFNAAGYKYTHAGENLAKDFSSTDSMVAAWMASPSHRANILNDKFQDIGIAVVPGNLQGQDTVLVVQLFGSTAAGSVATGASTPQVAQVQGAVAPTQAPTVTPVPSVAPVTAPTAAPVMELKEFATPAPSPNIFSHIFMNTFDLKRYAALATTGLLILVLIGDVMVTESKNISRRVGKNWAHILFINVILIVVTIVNAGHII